MKCYPIFADPVRLNNFLQFKKMSGTDEIHENTKTIKLLEKIRKMKDSINEHMGLYYYEHNDEDEDLHLLDYNKWVFNKWKEMRTLNINSIDISHNNELTQYLHDLTQRLQYVKDTHIKSFYPLDYKF
jgi:hypothetical protein